MALTALPDALPRIRAAIDAGILKAGNWGDGNDAVCLMSAAAPGARNTDDCVTAGWPAWLSGLNILLFDRNVGAEDEDAARFAFALAMGEAVSVPRDMDRAHDLFFAATLEQISTDDADADAAITKVIALYQRRLAGKTVAEEEWEAARDTVARGAVRGASPYSASHAALSAAFCAACPPGASAAAVARAASLAAARANLMAALTAA